jgi:site-specific DNA-methyltransferase (adenine-specific)
MLLQPGQIYFGDAGTLLERAPPTHAVIADAMFGTSPRLCYDWGPDPAGGDPIKHWQHHQPLYELCRHVLRDGGVLAWCQGIKFCEHFASWFGAHGLWPLCRNGSECRNWTSYHLWVVQTKEKQAIPLPTEYKWIRYGKLPVYSVHPCPKPWQEPAYLIEHLTKPGDLIIDPFCGLGSTLVAAERLNRRWIGIDKSAAYCDYARNAVMEIMMKVLDESNFWQTVMKRVPHVVLCFASWCNDCHRLRTHMQGMHTGFSYQQIRLAQLNVDSCPHLVEELGITSVPTLLIFRRGQVLARILGQRSETDLMDMLRYFSV